MAVGSGRWKYADSDFPELTIVRKQPEYVDAMRSVRNKMNAGMRAQVRGRKYGYIRTGSQRKKGKPAGRKTSRESVGQLDRTPGKETGTPAGS